MRPTIFDRPLSPAERMRRHRARKAHPLPAPRDVYEALARKPRKQQADYLGISLRQWYYLKEFRRYREIKWSGDVLNGKHGKIGIAFLAWVCKFGDRDAQQTIHDCIRREGAAATRRKYQHDWPAISASNRHARCAAIRGRASRHLSDLRSLQAAAHCLGVAEPQNNPRQSIRQVGDNRPGSKRNKIIGTASRQ
jgi:hypothetical protein